VIRSINYFADAEDDPDPESLVEITWEKVKEIVKEAIYNYYNRK